MTSHQFLIEWLNIRRGGVTRIRGGMLFRIDLRCGRKAIPARCGRSLSSYELLRNVANVERMMFDDRRGWWRAVMIGGGVF